MKIIDLKDRTIFIDDIIQIYKEDNYCPTRYHIQTNNGTYRITMEDYYKIQDYLLSLNDEIEILEEKKKIPKKLNIEDDENTITLFGKKENEWTILDNVDVIICNKINEIIDYLKNKGE